MDNLSALEEAFGSGIADVAGCIDWYGGGSMLAGYGLGIVVDVGGYEGAPRGAILVYTDKSQASTVVI